MSGFGFPAVVGREVILAGSAAAGLSGAGFSASSTCFGASRGDFKLLVTGSVCSIGMTPSLASDGFGDNTGFEFSDAPAVLSLVRDSAGVSFFGKSNLRRAAGLSILSDSVGVSFFAVSMLREVAGLSCRSLMGEVLPEPNGSAADAFLPRSTLLRCCLMRLISAIHAGCAGGGCLSLGESGLLSALSNQLDFVGLHRFEGLGGDVSSCSCSRSLYVEWTDLLRAWCGSAGLTNSSLEVRSVSRPFIVVALL